MTRIQRKLKRHFKYRKHVYARAFIIISLLAITFWITLTVEEGEVTHKDVVKTLSGTPEEKYQRALDKLEEGDLTQARMMMLRQARLADSSKNPFGYGKAHLWIAKDMLGKFKTDFLWSFPSIQGARQSEVHLTRRDEILTAQKHLEHAIILNPEIELAPELLAATYAAQDRRNQAIEVLLLAVSNEEKPHSDLHVPLANLLLMDGDDLALKEWAWDLFSSSGKAVGLGQERNVFQRVRYVLSALILGKYENAQIVIKRLEAQYPSLISQKNKDLSSEENAVKAIRMAYHYHKAVRYMGLVGSENSEDLSRAVDELELVLKMYPESKYAIEALSSIAIKYSTQKTRIQHILKANLLKVGSHRGGVKSSILIHLASMSSAGAAERRYYIEQAVKEDPKNGRALVELVELLILVPDVDVKKIETLCNEALLLAEGAQKIRCYRLLGWLSTRKENWNEAVIYLEKSFTGKNMADRDRLLLAQAYEALGKSKIAESHRQLVVGSK